MKYFVFVLLGLFLTGGIHASDNLDKEITVTVGDTYSSDGYCMLVGYNTSSAATCAKGVAVPHAFDACRESCQYCVLKRIETIETDGNSKASNATVKATFQGLNCESN